MKYGKFEFKSTVNRDCHWANFHEAHPSCTTYCSELPYRISRKFDRRFSLWYSVTDGRTWLQKMSLCAL